MHRPDPSARHHRSLRLTAAAGVLLTVLALASAAGAHEGKAVITVESQTADAMSVDYVVRAVWDSDGHAAADATATVVAEHPDGTRVGPVAMEAIDDDGRYRAAVEFPSAGEWQVRFTVVTPPGTLEIAQTVGDPASAPATSSTAAPTSSTAPASTAAPEGVAEVAAAGTDERERPTSNGGAAIFFFTVVAIIGGACLLAYRSRGQRRAQSAARIAAASTGAPADASDPRPSADVVAGDEAIGGDAAEARTEGDQ